jgi:rhodanese-related sulfurtransferase
MKRNLLYIIAIATLWSVACSPTTNPEEEVQTSTTVHAEKAKSSIQVLSTQQFAEKIGKASPLQLVDVRTSAEFKAGHLEHAINIDVNSASFLEDFKKSVSTEQPVFLYCKSGSRSDKAAKIIAKQGFLQVYNLDGGYLAWTRTPQYQAPDVKTVTDH